MNKAEKAQIEFMRAEGYIAQGRGPEAINAFRNMAREYIDLLQKKPRSPRQKKRPSTRD